MQFASGIPWWALVLVAAALVAAAWGAYVGAIVPLTGQKRTALIALRALTLLLLVVCLLRPVRVMPPDEENKAIVPILVDASAACASAMRTAVPGSRPRARSRVAAASRSATLTSSLKSGRSAASWTKPAGDRPIAADEERSDLSGALRTVQRALP